MNTIKAQPGRERALRGSERKVRFAGLFLGFLAI